MERRHISNITFQLNELFSHQIKEHDILMLSLVKEKLKYKPIIELKIRHLSWRPTFKNIQWINKMNEYTAI